MLGYTREGRIRTRHVWKSKRLGRSKVGSSEGRFQSNYIWTPVEMKWEWKGNVVQLLNNTASTGGHLFAYEQEFHFPLEENLNSGASQNRSLTDRYFTFIKYVPEESMDCTGSLRLATHCRPPQLPSYPPLPHLPWLRPGCGGGSCLGLSPTS